MAKYICPACRKRIPEDRRCVRCGWRCGDAEPAQRVPTLRWVRVAMVIALILTVGALGVYRSTGDSIADWYAEFALRHLPAQFSTFAPAETPSGAFHHCISRVVKQVSDGSTVETFPAYSVSNTVTLGGGRYSVQSVLEGVRLDGVAVRRSFTCVVRFDRGRWVMESLTVE
ncbi:MAG TPA: hypothetical protein VHG28_07900 [Longimicrobiaceae bacterium]|nr:hypothetical protein [Longimicrobiaceae bacterium]